MEQDVADQGIPTVKLSVKILDTLCNYALSSYKTIFSRDELDLVDRIMHCSSDGKSLLYAMWRFPFSVIM